MTETEFAELAAGWALNALDPADARMFEQALAEHPEWARHVAGASDAVAALSEAVPDAAPPAGLRQRLLIEIEADAAGAGSGVAGPRVAQPGSGWPASGVGAKLSGTPADKDDAPRRRLGARGWFALAASVALLLGLGFGTATIAQQLARSPVEVAIDEVEQAPDARRSVASLEDGGEAVVYSSASTGQAVFVATGLPEVPEGSTFELWLVGESGPVSAGTFAADAAGRAGAILEGDYHQGDVVAVTVEQDGGAPGGQPTTDPIVAVPT